jgi:hypothetical protein
MIQIRRVTLIATTTALVALTGAVPAAGRAIFSVAYRGWTMQSFPATPKPTTFHGVIRIDVDRTNNRVAFIGLRMNCTATSGYIVTAHANAKIDRRGNFSYTPTASHLTLITGHVTRATVMGKFTGTKPGCKVNGSYSAVPGATWPPEPTP